MSEMDHYQVRCELVRAGRLDLAGLEIGDVVSISETEYPWVDGPWIGKLMKAFEAGDKYVKLLSQITWRTARPSQEYLDKGLYLTRQDKVTLLEPASPDGYSDY